MADPTDPPTLPDPVAVQQATADYLAYSDSQTQIAQTAPAASNAINGVVDSTLQVVANSPKVIAAMLGISQASSNFTAGIDSGKMVTFNSQLDKLGEVAKRNGTGIGTLTTIVKGLSDSLIKSGMDGNVVTSTVASFGKNLAGVVPVLIDYAKNIAKVGDNQKVIGQGMIEQAAAAGNLGMILARSKDDFQDFGKLAQEQQQVWDNVTKATGMSRDEIAKYSATLNKVPGIMNELINSSDHGRRASENFTKTLNLFQISGRQYADITKDMTTATMELGTTEAGAIDYTARLSLVAQKLGVPFEDMHKAITASAAAFKMFATEGAAGDAMAKNLEASMGGYIKMLRDVNIPMGNAIEMAQNFAGAINQMSIGQKAFMSGQSGGPGGLMGAFQIDKMMNEGKIDEVFSKVQGTLRKQLGNIVTTTQASQSQAAAEQMTRQIMILKQGPLGQFAKTDAEAEKLLDAMAKPGGTTDMKALTKDMQKDKPLDVFLSAGNKIQQGSQNILSNILTALGESETVAVGGTAKTTQQMTGRMYNRVGEGAGNPDLQANIRANQKKGTQPGSGSSVENLTRDLKDIPNTLKLTLATLGKAISSGNRDSIRSADEKLQKNIADYKAKADSMPENQRKTALESIKTISDTTNTSVRDAISKSMIATMPGSRTTDTFGQVVAPKITDQNEDPALLRAKQMAALQPGTQDEKDRVMSPGQMVGQAVHTNAATTAAVTAIKNGAATVPGHPLQGTNGQPIPVMLAPGTTIAVNFNGKCPHCGTHVSVTEAGIANSPQSQASR